MPLFAKNALEYEMVYYITKTHPNLAHLKLDARVMILPLITLQTCFVEDLEEKLAMCDSLIFTSKNGIHAFWENLQSRDPSLRKLWLGLPNFVIGEASAKALNALGMKAEFIASSAYGDVFAKELVLYLKGKKPLFLRAKRIASNLPEVLRSSGIPLQEAIVYENIPHRLDNPPKLQQDSIIIFGAPSHIRAFLLNFSWDRSFCALCIGAKTSMAARELLAGGELKILQAPQPSFQSALELALQQA